MGADSCHQARVSRHPSRWRCAAGSSWARTLSTPISSGGSSPALRRTGSRSSGSTIRSNDVSNLREAAEAIADAGAELAAGLVYSSGPTGETEPLVEQASQLPELGVARVILHDPTGSLQPHRAHELVTRLREASGLPVGVYCQGAGGNALAVALEAARRAQI